MSERNPTVVVTSDETLPGIVARLRAAARGGRTVHLVVPIDSSLLLTAGEFRALKEAIDEHRLPVLIRTSDPLRLQLADRLGLRAEAMPRPRPAVPAAAVAPPVIPVPETDEGTPSISSDEADLRWPNHNGEEPDAADEDAQDGEAAQSEPAMANPPRRWLPVAAALAALVAAAVLAIRFVLPQATITIVPRTAPVAASLLFDVTHDGKPLDDAAAFAIAPQQREIEVVWSGSTPVTGVRVEPDGTASGPIELRNASPEPIAVETGTVVATETGVEFSFTETVSVPALDAASGAPGAATGSVRAVLPGSGGNVGTGEIGGRLPNGVYYSNRMQPTSGGTDKEFPVVSGDDLTALSAAAKAAAPELAAAKLGEAEPGMTIVPSSVTVSAQSDAFDHQAGDEADSLSLRATLTVHVEVFDVAAAAGQFEPLLAALLGDEAPAGFAVDAAEIAYQAPVEVSAREGSVRMKTAAEANAVAVFDDTEQQKLAAELAGASAEDAAAVVAAAPEVAEFRVDYSPAWLPQRMPNNAGRIRFEVAQ